MKNPKKNPVKNPMTKLRLFGAAAVVISSALASPVMAQQVITNPGRCAQYYPDANCQNLGPNNPYTGDYQRRRAHQAQTNQYANQNNGNWDNGWNNNGWNNNGWHDSRNDNRWQQHDSGFGPGDVAAGAAGAAVGTAAGIATSPFRNDAYAYYNSGPGYNDSYAARNGFVCQPGTWFKGEDGRRHPCQ
jgi:hypothetical protein